MSDREEKEEFPPEKAESLEEKFNRLRGQGMKDEDIIRQIFQEDLNADVSEICAITGLDHLTVGRIKGQIARWAKKPKEEEESIEEKAEFESEITEGEPPPPSAVKMSPREYVALFGEEGLKKLKRQRLVEFLNIAPGVGKRMVAWVLKQFDLDEAAQKDPNSLMSLLVSAGIKDNVAYRVVNALISLEDEFSDVLRRQIQPYGFYPSRRQETTGYPIFPSVQPPTSQFGPFPRFSQQPPQYPQYPPYSYDYGYGYPPPVRSEDVARRVIEELRREQQAQAQVQQAQQPQQQIVTITEPLRDAEGRLIYDRDGNPVYRKITGPVSQLGLVSQEDPEIRLLKKMKEYKELIKPEKTEFSVEKIAEIIEKKLESKEEKITKEDVLKASQQAAAQVLAAKEQEDREEKRFERLERAIRESASAKTIEGYQQDQYRLIGQGLQTLATREPKTVKIIVEGVKDILYGPPGAATKEVEAGARESILGKISEKYVSEE
jgi:hypothetical protein